MRPIVFISLASLLWKVTNAALPGGALNLGTGIVSSTSTVSSSDGSLTAKGTDPISGGGPRKPVRIAYQGEPGAYSECSLRELLGPHVTSVGRPNFEACYRAVASRECDYAFVPVENSLGGSIHENYDLMLRYDLSVVAEHEFRVHHCLLVKPGVKKSAIKYAVSHPQALAQCDNYLRSLGITPVPMYDTAGSAKILSEGVGLPDKCTPENTAAIASDLAGKTYRLNCLEKGIEDDDVNFTRFLLLSRTGIVQHLNPKIPSKTSIVFTLPDSAGALYKALACFALRDIDFSKIESRPTAASLLNYLKFRSQQAHGRKARQRSGSPRFRYCFYLDFLASEVDEISQNALHHLNEQSDYLRILGSYPQKSRLVGPIAAAVEELKNSNNQLSSEEVSLSTLPSDEDDEKKKLNIGIIGYGVFGEFLSKQLVKKHKVSCIDPFDKSKEAEEIGVDYYPMFDMMSFLSDLDVVIIAVPMIEFEDVVSKLPVDKLRGKLVVEVCPLNSHPKSVMLQNFGPDVDILCSNPMFGPSLSDNNESPSPVSWDGLPMIYEKVRIADMRRCDKFLSIFERERCQMVEMTAEQHDASTSDAEFVTHLTGRLLDRQLLPPTPVMSKEYAALCDVADMTAADSFDLFYGMFKYNSRAKDLLKKMRENIAKVERQLAAKEAYLAASAEMKNNDRKQLIEECKILLREVASSSNIAAKVEEKDGKPAESKITKTSQKES
mmetsp:Transcript_46454/g.70117  ORF Transcript_46454/g.70117 Transcript_46454/m.70117 type:complete len:722 (+) Transcript_46454:154-2319(+)